MPRLFIVMFLVFTLSATTPAEELSAQTAAQALRKATDFYRTRLASHGGYVWRYSEDLTLREGEGKVDAETIWVQPPGTPSVGMAFLAAFEATGEQTYLDAARESAHALVKGQLRSGGWTYKIHFDPEARKSADYRTEPERPRAFKVTTLDDNTTQSALRLMMNVDKALQFKDEKIHEAAMYALDCLSKAQFPNGAWPQGFDSFPDAEKFPVKPAAFPADWRELPHIKNYWNHYTLNDNLHADMISTFFEAGHIYGDAKYKKTAERAGDFLILAQLPEPQPAWAQQYNAEMQPAWARKFEPPAITGSESQGALRALMRTYRETGNRKYLEPIPRALAYLKRSQLPGDTLARFYELNTNKPLYFTRDYQITYSDEDLPTHYSFKIGSAVDQLTEEFEALQKVPADKLLTTAPAKMNDALIGKARVAIAALDAQGRWVEDGKLKTHRSTEVMRIIDSQTFCRNVEILSRYIHAAKQNR